MKWLDRIPYSFLLPLAVVMAGTNDLGVGFSPEETARAVQGLYGKRSNHDRHGGRD